MLRKEFVYGDKRIRARLYNAAIADIGVWGVRAAYSRMEAIEEFKNKTGVHHRMFMRQWSTSFAHFFGQCAEQAVAHTYGLPTALRLTYRGDNGVDFLSHAKTGISVKSVVHPGVKAKIYKKDLVSDVHMIVWPKLFNVSYHPYQFNKHLDPDIYRFWEIAGYIRTEDVKEVPVETDGRYKGARLVGFATPGFQVTTFNSIMCYREFWGIEGYDDELVINNPDSYHYK